MKMPAFLENALRYAPPRGFVERFLNPAQRRLEPDGVALPSALVGLAVCAYVAIGIGMGSGLSKPILNGVVMGYLAFTGSFISLIGLGCLSSFLVGRRADAEWRALAEEARSSPEMSLRRLGQLLEGTAMWERTWENLLVLEDRVRRGKPLPEGWLSGMGLFPILGIHPHLTGPGAEKVRRLIPLVQPKNWTRNEEEILPIALAVLAACQDLNAGVPPDDAGLLEDLVRIESAASGLPLPAVESPASAAAPQRSPLMSLALEDRP